MAKVTGKLKSAKNWNLLLIFLTSMTVAFDLIGLPGILNPDQKNYIDSYKDLKVGKEQSIKIFEYMNSTPVKAMAVAGLVLSAGLLVWYILNHLKLKKGLKASIIPYCIFILWQFCNFLFEKFFQADPRNTWNVSSFFFSIAVYALICLPAIMVVWKLAKPQR